jgi:RNA polymerase sigma factor (sigma-70 family)
MSLFVEQLRSTVLRNGGGVTDGQLLDSFVRQRDAAALAALVGRHGPMVWGVCCRLLRSRQDAEDAFQATFLVLVQKGATLPDKEMVGNWLFGVARQTAVRMRAIAAKRGVRERQVTVMPEPTRADPSVNDLRPFLDEELSRLPDKYRVLLVLCDLEGKTRKDAARQLGVPEGTIASRLATARGMLAKRLAQRGLIVPSGMLAAMLAQEAASASLPSIVISATIKAATSIAAGHAAAGAISPSVASLMTGVTKAMCMTKIKNVMVLLAIGLAVGATGLWLVASSTAQPETKASPVKAMADGGGLVAAVAAEEELAALQGVWLPLRYEEHGREFSPECKHFIKGNKVTVQVNGETIAEGKLVLDSTKSPKRLDFVFPPGQTGQKHSIIYVRVGDHIIYCGNRDRKTRPTEFSTGTANGGDYLIAWKIEN